VPLNRCGGVAQKILRRLKDFAARIPVYSVSGSMIGTRGADPDLGAGSSMLSLLLKDVSWTSSGIQIRAKKGWDESSRE
jgi:hypothetical protein